MANINRETLEAIKEVQYLKNNPAKKSYDSFDKILEELNDEISEEFDKKILNKR